MLLIHRRISLKKSSGLNPITTLIHERHHYQDMKSLSLRHQDHQAGRLERIIKVASIFQDNMYDIYNPLYSNWAAIRAKYQAP